MNEHQKLLADLHRRVDQHAQALAARHADRLVCKMGCDGCCVDDLTVFQIEADRIAAHHAELLQTEHPAPVGRCAFLDDAGACRVYEHRPYVCRTQGLPLRWLEEDEVSWELVEYRDICPLNDEGEPIETLPEEACWTIGDTETALAQLQEAAHGDLSRIALRSLWQTTTD